MVKQCVHRPHCLYSYLACNTVPYLEGCVRLQCHTLLRIKIKSTTSWAMHARPHARVRACAHTYTHTHTHTHTHTPYLVRPWFSSQWLCWSAVAVEVAVTLVVVNNDKYHVSKYYVAAVRGMQKQSKQSEWALPASLLASN